MKKPIKLEQEIVKLLLPRLKDEFDASYLYRAISNWCQGVGYFKAAEFFAKESEDELAHAKGIEKYLVDWNVIVSLPKIETPTSEFTDLIEVLDKAYVIEYKLYEEYEDTSMKVFKTGDLCTFDFLQGYRTIQRLSVAEYSDLLNAAQIIDPTNLLDILHYEEIYFKV